MAEVRDSMNPLGPSAIDAVRQAEAKLQAINLLIERGCRCGLDMRAEQALCDALRERVALVLGEFGGQRKSR